MRLGPLGEQLAAAELRRLGYEIVTHNYRNRFGEIDIIAVDHGSVVFIEVKARRSRLYGGPKAAVTRTKQHRLRRLAAMWVAEQHRPASGYRFDVVCIVMAPDGGVESCEVIRHAF